MIVAVSDFNMGAMENKGLNIFNTKYVLANPATATDADYANIESVVGHEYFHNWTGNRVTCRDWFQLSLKEGLTVFRDQEFSQDLAATPRRAPSSASRTCACCAPAQFPEDAGPMAHPVRPDSYIEINNFYTVDRLRKGRRSRAHDADAGRPRGLRRRGMHAVLRAPRRPGRDLRRLRAGHGRRQPRCDLARLLPQFKRWYSQAGTPRRDGARPLRRRRRAPTRSALAQSCPPTPGQPAKEPFVIPVDVGLLGARRPRTAAAARRRARRRRATTRMLVLTRAGAAVHLRRRRRRARAVAPARLLGAGDPRRTTTATPNC